MRDPKQVRIAALVKNDRWVRAVKSLELSSRQRQIVECVLDGANDEAQIAERLGISPHTVHVHMGRMYGKLHVTSRSELLAAVFIAYATDAGGAMISLREHRLPPVKM